MITNKIEIIKNKVEKERWKIVENVLKRWLNSNTLGYYLRRLIQWIVIFLQIIFLVIIVKYFYLNFLYILQYKLKD